MGQIKRRVLGVAAVGAMMCAGLGSPAWAATTARDIPAPQVRIRDVGDLQQYGSAALTLSVRCFGGALASELTIKVTQGQAAGEQSNAREDIVCDGVRRDVLAFPYSDDGADFVAGSAMVTTRLTVLDPQTMAPLPQVSATQSVYLRPFVTVKIANGPIRLDADGSAVVRASLKCWGRYEVADFSVRASQNGGWVQGTGDVEGENPTCDGTFQEYTFTVVPNKPFVPGGMQVSVTGNLLDVDTGDPVDQAIAGSRRHAVRGH